MNETESSQSFTVKTSVKLWENKKEAQELGQIRSPHKGEEKHYVK